MKKCLINGNIIKINKYAKTIFGIVVLRDNGEYVLLILSKKHIENFYGIYNLIEENKGKRLLLIYAEIDKYIIDVIKV